jgi:hypothetical protein
LTANASGDNVTRPSQRSTAKAYDDNVTRPSQRSTAKASEATDGTYIRSKFSIATEAAGEIAFSIGVPEKEKNLLPELEEVAKRTARKLESLYNLGLPRTISVQVFDSENDFLRSAPVTFPEWGAGAALSGSHRILLKSPSIHFFRFPIRKILAHELGHLALFNLDSRRTIPLWFHEGFAMHVSGEERLSDHLQLFKAAVSKNLLPLDRLTASYPPRAQKVALAYIESYNAFDYLLQKKGIEGMEILFSKLREGDDWKDAFTMAFGMSPYAFSVEWLERVRRQYGWILLLGERGMLWSLITALVIFAGVVKFWKIRKKRRSWERMELTDEPDKGSNRWN